MCVIKAPAIIESQILIPIIPKTNLDWLSSQLFISNLNSICVHELLNAGTEKTLNQP